MNSFIENLATSPWLSVAGFIVGVVGATVGILGIILYFKGKKDKKPFYTVRGVNLVRDLVSKVESLEMLYAGQSIENLSVNNILFWNAGRASIRKSDIPKDDPLTIYAKNGYKILDIKILQIKKEANNFSLTQVNDRTYKLTFDYIDKNEGVVIQVFHNSKSTKDIKLSGTIIESKPIKKVTQESTEGEDRRGLFAILLMFSMLLLFFSLFRLLTGTRALETSVLEIMVFSLLIVISAVVIIRDYYAKRIPKGFDAFKEELLTESEAGKESTLITIRKLIRKIKER